MCCNLRLIGIVLLSIIGFFTSGLSLKYSHHLIEIVRENVEFLRNDPLLSWAEVGALSTIALGCFGCWIPLQYLGRRSTLELMAVPLHILGSSLTFIFHHVIHDQYEPVSKHISIILFLGICMQGVSSGLTFVASPVYISETLGVVSSKSFLIGILLLTSQLATTAALLIASIFPVMNETYYFHLLPPACHIVSLIGFHFLPESPRWLLFRRFQVKEAKSALQDLMRQEEKTYRINKKLLAYQKEYEIYKADRSVTTYIHLLLMVIGLCSLWHLHGVHIYDFYASWTIKFAGISSKWAIDPNILSLCIRFSSLSILISLYLIINKTSFHTTFLMFASCVITLSLTMTGICFYSFEEDIEWISTIYWLPLATYLTFQFAFWLGSGSQAYVISVVISPASLRPSIYSIGGTTFWLAEICSSRLVIPMISSLHPFGTFWFFAGMSAISLVFLMCSVFPEINAKEDDNVKMNAQNVVEIDPLHLSKYHQCNHI